MRNLMMMLGLTRNSNIKDIMENLKEYFKEREYEKYIDENDILAFKKGTQKFVLEYIRIPDKNKYVVNMFYNYKLSKRKLLQEVFLNGKIHESIILYDSNSNNLVINNYEVISELENIIKFSVARNIGKTQGKCVFDILENIKVKDYIGIEYKNLIPSLQSIELSEIIKYINDNPLGGNEITILKNLNEENGEKELILQSELIKDKINKNIFSDIINKINSNELGDLLTECRNRIAHNGCVEEDIFKKYMNKCKKLKTQLENCIIKEENLDKLPNIAVLINSENKIEKILLSILEKLDSTLKIDILGDLIKYNGLIQRKDNKITYNNIEEKINVRIEIINSEINVDKDINGQLFKIYINFDEKINDKLNDSIYKLCGEIGSKFLVIYDSISDGFRKNLCKHINSVENLVRLYVKLSEKILAEENSEKENKKAILKSEMKINLDLNAIKLGVENNKINFINNDLYEMDFVDLLDKLSYPLIEKSYKDLIKNVEKEDLNKSMADLSSLDDNIDKIRVKWKELYRIRTMVVHNFIVNKSEYNKFKSIYQEANSEIKRATYRLFTENLIKSSLDYEIIEKNNSLKFSDFDEKIKMQLIENNTIKSIYTFEKYDICKVINLVQEMKLELNSIFIKKELINKLGSKKIEIDDNLLDNIFKDNKIDVSKRIIKSKSTKAYKLESGINQLLNELYTQYSAI